MEIQMALTAPTYALASATSSASVTLTPAHMNCASVLVTNPTSSYVFVTSGTTAPTAAFPASATVPVAGVVIPPNMTRAYAKPVDHGFLAAISSAVDASKSVFFTLGSGD
jgi:hypothetical protein